MNAEQAEQYDLRKVSIHEAAHVVVAEHHGLVAWAEVWRHIGGDPVNEKAFAGRAHVPGIDRLTREAQTHIGLAGLVAEHLDDDRDLAGIDFYDWIECGAIELSMTDAMHAGMFMADDCDVVLNLCRSLWSGIELKAERLVKGAAP